MTGGAIQFVTLLLGLLSGPHPVALQVDAGVAKVEVRLDGALAGTLEAAPWTLDVDFGQGLAPRLLEAVAFDATGTEIGRATQSINLPRPQAEATISLERDARGTPVAARVHWQDVLGSRPWALRATLDGTPLAGLDLDRVALPPIDPKAFHWLQVELEFPGGAVAEAQLDFGGGQGDEISRAITAVPLRRRGGQKLRAADLDGLLHGAGGDLEVVALERGGAELLVVRGRGVAEAMEQLDGTARDGAGASVSAGGIGLSGLGDLRPGASASVSDVMRQALTLDDDVELRLLLPVTKKTQAGDLSMEVFPASPRIASQQGGLYWALTQDVTLPGTDGGQRLADAVAVAGLRAALGNHRRAVVLVVGADSEETSLYDARQVKGYLRSLGVPLAVWSVDPRSTDAGAWGEASDVSDFPKLRRAVSELTEDLDRQVIAWVEGTYLPQAVSVAPSKRVERVE